MVKDLSFCKIIPLLILLLTINYAEIVNVKPIEKIRINHLSNVNYYNTINKVSLTQKGYIQFLRYIVDVPIITQFTFCIWLNSANLSYAHPLLSYSRHEEERYIRAWVSPHGKAINLAILENEVFTVPTYFRENNWYHICTSWESHRGTWSLYLNGKLKASNRNLKLRGLQIPKGGDIVVGQEYTDFDKGLDDGIEGDVFGFNMVLAPTTSFQEVSNNFLSPHEFSDRGFIVHANDPHLITPRYRQNPYLTRQRHRDYNEVPYVLGYFDTRPNRSPKGLDKTILSVLGILYPDSVIEVKTTKEISSVQTKPFERSIELPHKAKRIIKDYDTLNNKPLGLQLVELSYNCALGGGAPINHEKVLINWTKTPVRVFGGAILKKIRPFCYNDF